MLLAAWCNNKHMHRDGQDLCGSRCAVLAVGAMYDDDESALALDSLPSTQLE
jgi:hypothetical protein